MSCRAPANEVAGADGRVPLGPGNRLLECVVELGIAVVWQSDGCGRIPSWAHAIWYALSSGEEPVLRRARDDVAYREACLALVLLVDGVNPSGPRMRLNDAIARLG